MRSICIARYCKEPHLLSAQIWPVLVRGPHILPATHTRTIPAFTPQLQSIGALWLVLIVPTHWGMARMSWRGWLDIYWDRFPAPGVELQTGQSPMPVLTGPGLLMKLCWSRPTCYHPTASRYERRRPADCLQSCSGVEADVRLARVERLRNGDGPQTSRRVPATL